jgi:hypothetical protein
MMAQPAPIHHFTIGDIAATAVPDGPLSIGAPARGVQHRGEGRD